jgi:hypothetical protein
MIFEHAGDVLRKCLVVETEVEFVPLYDGQPLFADVDQVLRRAGFMFHRFRSIAGRPIKPLMTNNNPSQAISQVLWGDAVYVPDLLNLEAYDAKSLLKLVALLHEVYQSVDLCHYVLSIYDQKAHDELAKRYFARLTRVPA